MKVTKKDLIGGLRGVPLEIAQAMVDEQVRQCNVANVMVFQDCRMKDINKGGFSWHNSKEGLYFWRSVLCYNEFEKFFEKYPKQEPIKNVQTPSGVNYLIINPE